MNEFLISLILMSIKFIVSLIFIKKILLKDEDKIALRYMLFMIPKDFVLVLVIIFLIKKGDYEFQSLILNMMIFYFLTLIIELYILYKSFNDKKKNELNEEQSI